jgi:hypothetical protein
MLRNRSNAVSSLSAFLVTRSAMAALIALLAAACGGPVDSANVTQSAHAQSAGSGLGSFRLSSPAVSAGGTVLATVSLSSSAESSSGGVIVYLSFPSASLAGPRFVRIPNGSSSATVTLYTNPFLSSTTTASVGANTSTPQPAVYLSQLLTVTPSTSPTTARPQVTSLTLSPATVPNGSTSTGTVTIDAPAPPGGAVVQLNNSGDFFNTDADFAPVAIVPAGATSASFTVRTHLSSSIATSGQEIIVGNFFGGTFQGAYLTIQR